MVGNNALINQLIFGNISNALKTHQHFTTTSIGAGIAALQYNLSPVVDQNKSIVAVKSVDTLQNTNPSSLIFGATFLSNSQVQIQRNSTAAITTGLYIDLDVYEFYNVKQKQAGTYNFTVLTGTIALPIAVNPQKCILYISYYTNNTVTSYVSQGFSYYHDSNTIYLRQAQGNKQIFWQLIEFY